MVEHFSALLPLCYCLQFELELEPDQVRADVRGRGTAEYTLREGVGCQQHMTDISFPQLICILFYVQVKMTILANTTLT